MKKNKRILALILSGGIMLSTLFGVWLNVNAEDNDYQYTITEETLNKIAVGRCNTGYITGGRVYVSYGNETIGVNDDGGTNYFEPRYIYLPEGQHAIDLEKGNFHTLVLTREGKVFSLGDNEYGQLGNGSYEDSEEFIDLSEYFNNEKVVQISANGYHSLALTENGNVYAWGYNKYGQVSPEKNETINIPTLYEYWSGENIKTIETSGYSSFVLTFDGYLYGWGFNGYGNLGCGDTNRRYEPERVWVLDPVSTISAGKQHAMALTNDGELYMWGKNDFYQIEHSDNEFYSDAIKITEFNNKTIKSITAGGNSSCVITENDIIAWGDNSYKQLGTTNLTPPSISMRTEAFSEIYEHFDGFELTIGDCHSAFLSSDHKIFTCGSNMNGQAATGIKEKFSELQDVTNKFLIKNNKIQERNNKPLKTGLGYNNKIKSDVFTLPDYNNTEVYFHSNDLDKISVDKSGNITWFKENIATDVYGVWIENDYIINSDFENPDYKDYILPYKVVTYEDEVIAAGRNHTMYLKFNEKLIGWGSNKYGQLGINRTSTKQSPISFYLSNNGKIHSVKCGYNHTVILTASGKVYTFGLNDYGQLGDGTNVDKSNPVSINGLDSPVMRIEASARQTFVITQKGSVYSWGANNYGQLGDGTTTTRTSPVNITSIFGGEAVENIISGYYSTYAITESGRVFSWGYGSKGNLGDGTTIGKKQPVEITDSFDGERIYKIDAGAQHAIALTYSGNAYVWGYNDKNQLGISGEIVETPTKINIKPVCDVFADESNIGYLTEDGEMIMLGDNAYNQIGTELPPAFKLTFGQRHSAMLDEDGNIYVSGGNNYGQLGISDVTQSDKYINIKDKIDVAVSEGKTGCELVISNLTGNILNVYVTANNIVDIKDKTFKITYDPLKLSLDDGCIITVKKETTPQKIQNSFLHITSVTNGEICFKYEFDTTKKLSGWINGLRFISKTSSAKEINIELLKEEITE